MRQILQSATSGLMLFAAACGGDSDTPPAGGGGTPNRAPVFTSAAAVSVPENTVGAFYTATTTDPDADAVTFSITTGGDADDFTITSTGALSFATPPDFETPADGDANNVYLLTLQASDGAAVATLNLTVTVTNLAEAFAVRRVTAAASAPLALVGRAGGDVLVAERAGRIRILDPSTGVFNAAPFLDIATTIGTAGEGGLLGLALAPDYAVTGDFYVHVTNTVGDTEIRRYRRSAGDPDLADAGSIDIILTVPQPS
ncbi:MAG: cadherin repeat domain-containing protein [Pseudomonadota bacterium]